MMNSFRNGWKNIGNLDLAFRRVIAKPVFTDLNQELKQRGKQKRYKIYPYSFKFASTKMIDTLGEITARAIKEDKEYVFTYDKKSMEEKTDVYRKMVPKLSVLGKEQNQD